MSQARVLVVEDERIVALHLQQRLKTLGYEIAAMAASGNRRWSAPAANNRTSS